jgi:tRNA U34 5-methylaminomethyl-2-thiouridine-forming methyltransferase MnmC
LKSKRIIQITEDGSHTISIEAMNVTYHSKHGAIQESRHVFIKEGLQNFIHQHDHVPEETINIFEIGFGSGLNALLSLQEAIENNQKIFYQTIEPYPLLIEEINKLNYASLINEKLQQSFYTMHECEWNNVTFLHPLFLFKKIQTGLQEFETKEKFQVIYFDAFDPNAQPGLWSEAIFKKMFDMLYPNGILVTYCSKGIVRRAMQAAGFKIEKLPGPLGKREITRANKLSGIKA